MRTLRTRTTRIQNGLSRIVGSSHTFSNHFDSTGPMLFETSVIMLPTVHHLPVQSECSMFRFIAPLHNARYVLKQMNGRLTSNRLEILQSMTDHAIGRSLFLSISLCPLSDRLMNVLSSQNRPYPSPRITPYRCN